MGFVNDNDIAVQREAQRIPRLLQMIGQGSKGQDGYSSHAFLLQSYSLKIISSSYLQQNSRVGGKNDVCHGKRIPASVVGTNPPALSQISQILNIHGAGENGVLHRVKGFPRSYQERASTTTTALRPPVCIPFLGIFGFLEVHTPFVYYRCIATATDSVIYTEGRARSQSYQGEHGCKTSSNQFADNLAQLRMGTAAEYHLQCLLGGESKCIRNKAIDCIQPQFCI